MRFAQYRPCRHEIMQLLWRMMSFLFSSQISSHFLPGWDIIFFACMLLMQGLILENTTMYSLKSRKAAYIRYVYLQNIAEINAVKSSSETILPNLWLFTWLKMFVSLFDFPDFLILRTKSVSDCQNLLIPFFVLSSTNDNKQCVTNKICFSLCVCDRYIKTYRTEHPGPNERTWVVMWYSAEILLVSSCYGLCIMGDDWCIMRWKRRNLMSTSIRIQTRME